MPFFWPGAASIVLTLYQNYSPMTYDTILRAATTLRRAASAGRRAIPVCIIMLVISAPALRAGSQDEVIKQKDAEIAALQAQVADLQAKLGGPAPVAAPVTTTATVTPDAAAPAATTSSGTAPKDSSILQMSAFDVRTTQGQGYSAGNSASALKTSESLMDLPAQIIVVTSDMIRDIGSHNASDVLAYAGLVGYYRGPAIMARGSRIGNAYIDDVPQASGIGVSDNTNIDTYQVIKGPEQVMYPLASLAGVVLETTKKPLPGVTQLILDEKVQQWGRQTFTFDANTPVGKIGDATLTTRMEGIVQTGTGPFFNAKDDRYGVFPSFELDYKNTTVVAEYDAEIFHYLPGGTGILLPNGGLYTGNGRRQENTPPNDYDTNEQHDVRLAWTQRLSDNWQIKTQGTYFNVARFGSAGFPTTVNWNNDTMTYTIRKDDAWNANFTTQSDVSGKYQVWKLPMTTAFGFNNGDQVTYSKYLATAPTVTVGIHDLGAINSIVFPPASSYPLPASGIPGSRTEQYVTNGYLSQSIDIIPKWVTVVGGYTESKIETVTDPNIGGALPFASTDANAHDLLHRFGIITHPLKDVSVYVSQSTTFSPGTGVNYANQPSPPVEGKSEELGVKTSLWDGKLSLSAAIYTMQLTNQTILAAYPALNPEGFNYYVPIGNTNSHGTDASATLLPFPGLQIVATGYIGTVHDTKGNPIPATVENSWSLFTRYDFDQVNVADFLKGFAVGGGATRAGGKWFNMGGIVLPGGAPLPVNSSGNSIFKLRQGTLVNLFVDYKLNRHWTLRVDCENILNSAYPIGAQGPGLVDPVDPRTFSFESTFKY